MNEVYAHAVLGIHQHVVRYYSAWAEDDYMYIQNEYCNGGLSLFTKLNLNTKSKITYIREIMNTQWKRIFFIGNLVIKIFYSF